MEIFPSLVFFFFFFNDTATTEIYTLSLHDALPIYPLGSAIKPFTALAALRSGVIDEDSRTLCHEKYSHDRVRSEEHTSELQSLTNLVCRLLLEKKKTSVLPRLSRTCKRSSP